MSLKHEIDHNQSKSMDALINRRQKKVLEGVGKVQQYGNQPQMKQVGNPKKSERSFSADQDGKYRSLEGFSLTYGGMWLEFHKEIQTLKKRNSDLENELSVKTQAVGLLEFSNVELQEKFKENLVNLKETKSEHCDLKDIFEQLQLEKEELKNRLLGLEDHLDWIKRQNYDLQQNVLHWKECYQQAKHIIADKDNEIQALSETTKNATMEIVNNREHIKRLGDLLEVSDKEKQVLRKSLSQKLKIINNLIKERDRLKSSIDDIAKNAKSANTPASPQKKGYIDNAVKRNHTIAKQLFSSPFRRVSINTEHEATPTQRQEVSEVNEYPNTIGGTNVDATPKLYPSTKNPWLSNNITTK